jgi:predicted dehydrogenase
MTFHDRGLPAAQSRGGPGAGDAPKVGRLSAGTGAMHKPRPIVLIGCGAVAQQFYLPALRHLESRGEIKVSSLVDPSSTARNVLAQAFPAATQSTSLAEVARLEGALAIIASPPRFHAEQTEQSFEKGWHVLCEKPMASTTAECERMVAGARAANRLLAVGLYKRFFPASAYIHDLIQHQRLGRLKHFTISEGGPFRWPAATPSFFNKAQTPGGVLLDIGVHVLDLLLWWSGEPARFEYEDDAMGGLETNVRLAIEFANGAEGVVHLSRDWKTRNEYRFQFERGEVRWRVNDANGLIVQLDGSPSALRSALVDPLSTRSESPALQPSNPQSFIRQIQNVSAAIDGREALLVPGEEGLRSLRWIEACYRQRTLIDQPWLSEAELARARTLAISL